jgi:ABC-type amino acid transport substrate-binding protein
MPLVRRCATAAVLLLLAAGAAACGSGGSAGSDPNAALNLVTPGTITAAVPLSSPPFASSGSDGRPTGFLIDLNDEIARRMGLKITYLTATESTALSGLTAHRYDMMAFGLVEEPEQAKAVAFTKPIYWGVNSTLVKAGSPEKAPADFAGKRVGASSASAQFTFAQQTFPSASVIAEPTNATGSAQLLDGNLDGFVVGGTQAAAFMAQNPGKLAVACSAPQAQPDAMALSKSEPAFQAAYGKQLAAAVTDGTFLKLYDQDVPGIPYPTDMTRFWPALTAQLAKK